MRRSLLACLVLGVAACAPMPLAAQARETEQPNPQPAFQPTSEQQAVSRFAAAVETGAYIDRSTAPFWLEVEKRLLAANRDREEAVAALIRDSRSRYRATILEIVPMLVGDRVRRMGQTADMAILAERALRYAATPAASAVDARMDSERLFCFVTRETAANCAPLAAELEVLRSAADPDLQAYATLLAAVRSAAVGAIATGMDRGPLGLIERDPVLAAGLAWPE